MHQVELAIVMREHTTNLILRYRQHLVIIGVIRHGGRTIYVPICLPLNNFEKICEPVA